MFNNFFRFILMFFILFLGYGCSQNKKLEEQIQELNKQKDLAQKESQELKKKLQEMKSDLLDAELTSEIERQTADAIYKELMDALKNEIASGEIQVKRLYKALIIRVSDTIFFNSGDYALKTAGKRFLDKIAPILKKMLKGKIIQIQGHTDNQIIGQNLIRLLRTNWELGAFRALEVLHYFENHSKISPEYLSAVSFSSFRPVDTNNTEAGRAKNRRIEIIVVDERIYKHDLDDTGKKTEKAKK